MKRWNWLVSRPVQFIIYFAVHKKMIFQNIFSYLNFAENTNVIFCDISKYLNSLVSNILQKITQTERNSRICSDSIGVKKKISIKPRICEVDSSPFFDIPVLRFQNLLFRDHEKKNIKILSSYNLKNLNLIANQLTRIMS